MSDALLLAGELSLAAALALVDPPAVVALLVEHATLPATVALPVNAVFSCLPDIVLISATSLTSCC